MKSLEQLIEESTNCKNSLQKLILTNVGYLLANILIITAIFITNSNNLPVVVKILQSIAIVLITYTTINYIFDLAKLIKYYLKTSIIIEILEESLENNSENKTKNNSLSQ